MMKKELLIEHLISNHEMFTSFIRSLPDDQYSFQKDEKWTASQQLDHIYRSIKRSAFFLSLTKSILKILFGSSNRESRSYENLVFNYKAKLDAGYKASGSFVPKNIPVKQRAILSKKLIKKVKKITAALDRFSEEELDLLVLPHPILGKITIRELLYFSIYHVEHHLKLSQKNLDNPMNVVF